MVSVVSSPTRVYIKIKTWDIFVIHPTPVIIMGAIPTTFPWTPPPTIPEKDVYTYIRNNVHIVRIRDHASNTMGGGSEIPIFIFTPAIVGIGTTTANVKRIVPNSNFFMLLPPLVILSNFFK